MFYNFCRLSEVTKRDQLTFGVATCHQSKIDLERQVDSADDFYENEGCQCMFRMPRPNDADYLEVLQ